MGVMKGPTEGGSGGGRGHSNMAHWLFSEEHKDFSRRRRRLNDKAESRAGLEELDTEVPPSTLRPLCRSAAGRLRDLGAVQTPL